MGIPLKVSVHRGAEEILSYSKTLDVLQVRVEQIKAIQQCMVNLIDQAQNRFLYDLKPNLFRAAQLMIPFSLLAGNLLITRSYQKGPYFSTSYKLIAVQILFSLWNIFNYLKIIYSQIFFEPLKVDVILKYELKLLQEFEDKSLDKLAFTIDLNALEEYKCGALNLIIGIAAITTVAFMALSRPYSAPKLLSAFFYLSALAMIIFGAISFSLYREMSKGATLTNQIKQCHPAS